MQEDCQSATVEADVNVVDVAHFLQANYAFISGLFVCLFVCFIASLNVAGLLQATATAQTVHRCTVCVQQYTGVHSCVSSSTQVYTLCPAVHRCTLCVQQYTGVHSGVSSSTQVYTLCPAVHRCTLCVQQYTGVHSCVQQYTGAHSVSSSTQVYSLVSSSTQVYTLCPAVHTLSSVSIH